MLLICLDWETTLLSSPRTTISPSLGLHIHLLRSSAATCLAQPYSFACRGATLQSRNPYSQLVICLGCSSPNCTRISRCRDVWVLVILLSWTHRLSLGVHHSSACSVASFARHLLEGGRGSLTSFSLFCQWSSLGSVQSLARAIDGGIEWRMFSPGPQWTLQSATTKPFCSAQPQTEAGMHRGPYRSNHAGLERGWPRRWPRREWNYEASGCL